MDINIKDSIKKYIDLLSDVLETETEFETWMPNCIECLNFALDNEQLLIEKPKLYEDTLSTLSLLYKWIIEKESWAYIELYQKFRKIYTGAEIGEAFKVLSNRINENKIRESTKESENSLISYTDNNGNFKAVDQILNELSQQWKL